MEGKLQQAQRVQTIYMVVCATFFSFGLSPQPTTDYAGAIRELDVIRSADLDEYDRQRNTVMFEDPLWILVEATVHKLNPSVSGFHFDRDDLMGLRDGVLRESVNVGNILVPPSAVAGGSLFPVWDALVQESEHVKVQSLSFNGDQEDQVLTLTEEELAAKKVPKRKLVALVYAVVMKRLADIVAHELGVEAHFSVTLGRGRDESRHIEIEVDRPILLTVSQVWDYLSVPRLQTVDLAKAATPIVEQVQALLEDLPEEKRRRIRQMDSKDRIQVEVRFSWPLVPAQPEGGGRSAEPDLTKGEVFLEVVDWDAVGADSPPNDSPAHRESRTIETDTVNIPLALAHTQMPEWWQELYDPANDIVLPNTLLFFSRIKDMSIAEAIFTIRRESEQSRKSVQVLGIEVDRDAVALAAPLMVSALLLYLLAHLSAAFAAMKASGGLPQNHAWLLMEKGPLPTLVSLVIMVGLQAAAFASLSRLIDFTAANAALVVLALSMGLAIFVYAVVQRNRMTTSSH